jgi:hypothetical protein
MSEEKMNRKATLTTTVTGQIEEFETTHAAVSIAMLGALHALREFKPNDRSEADRRYAVTITMMEQTYAYFSTWVLGDLSK